jgi:hypothetical protein
MSRTNRIFIKLKPAEHRTLIPNARFFAAVPAVLFFALFWPFNNGKKFHMTPSSQVPGARGVVQAQSTKNGNVQLDVNVDSLAHPSALRPPEQAYVVWVQPPGESPVNEGALKVDSKEHGELKVETPYKDVKVFITAEKYAQLKTPEGPTVLTADVTSS